jgi:serine/threonine protein kinase
VNGHHRFHSLQLLLQISGGTYQPTTISGNPPWMSPEQLGGLSLSFSADVWAFGVVMWELVTETLPWNEVASDLWAMRKRVFEEGHHLPIPQINASLSEIIDDARVVAVLIKLCFSRHPFARPSIAANLSSLQAIEERRSRVTSLNIFLSLVSMLNIVFLLSRYGLKI